MMPDGYAEGWPSDNSANVRRLNRKRSSARKFFDPLDICEQSIELIDEDEPISKIKREIPTDEIADLQPLKKSRRKGKARKPYSVRKRVKNRSPSHLDEGGTEVAEDKEDNLVNVCVTCGKTFPDTKFLDSHKKLSGIHHNNRCPKCPGVEFKSWPEHQAHQHKAHNGVFFKRCKHCPEVFDDTSTYWKHVRSTHDAEKVVCTECGASVSKQFLPIHLKRHGEKEHGCDECSKRFISANDLAIHKICHITVPCELCGKIVKQRSKKAHDLHYHTPAAEMPFVCPICVPTKGFIEKNPFDDHMNIHSGAKPHTCKLCPNVAYANRANLEAHIRSTHKGIKRKPK